jgi:hypothetical protein
VADVIADWKQTPGTVGIRIMMTEEVGRDPADPGLDRILRAAVQYDFPVNMLCWGNVEAGTALIDRHPETRFILDHLAILQPRTPPAPPEPWADLPKVLELAKRPNAVIKVSGACTLSKQPYPFPDIWDPLARVFDAWGFDRCLWGTDWTRAFAVVNYEQAVDVASDAAMGRGPPRTTRWSLPIGTTTAWAAQYGPATWAIGAPSRRIGTPVRQARSRYGSFAGSSSTMPAQPGPRPTPPTSRNRSPLSSKTRMSLRPSSWTAAIASSALGPSTSDSPASPIRSDVG